MFDELLNNSREVIEGGFTVKTVDDKLSSASDSFKNGASKIGQATFAIKAMGSIEPDMRIVIDEGEKLYVKASKVIDGLAKMRKKFDKAKPVNEQEEYSEEEVNFQTSFSEKEDFQEFVDEIYAWTEEDRERIEDFMWALAHINKDEVLTALLKEYRKEVLFDFEDYDNED